MLGINYAFYEDKYKDMLTGAFADDPKSYKTLLKAVHLFYTDKCQKAVALLEKLEPHCETIHDYTSVLIFKALSYRDMKLMNKSAETYEALLQRNPASSRAWSNLSLIYSDLGRHRDACDALRNAVAYDPDNPYAHCNLAYLYVKNGEAEKALESAHRAMALNPRLAPAMSAASVAYAMLGDKSNSERYFALYGANGGDAEALRDTLSRMSYGSR